MGVPDRRGATERRVGPPRGFSLVRGPITPEDERRIAQGNRPEWRRPLRRAIGWYQRNPVPGSLVHPKWVPVSWLNDVFPDIGIDNLVSTLIVLERDGFIIQRTMALGGVNHPVVTLDSPLHVPLHEGEHHFAPLPPGRIELPDGRLIELSHDGPLELEGPE